MPSGAYRRHRKATLADRRAAHASMSAAMRQVRLAEDWDALLDAVQCTEDAFVYGTEAIVVQVRWQPTRQNVVITSSSS